MHFKNDQELYNNDMITYIHHDILGGDVNFSIRKMFGGYGLYYNNTFFGMMVDDALYLYNTSTETPQTVFTYIRQGKTISLPHYVRIDDDIFDAPEELYECIHKAIIDAKER